MRRPAEFRRAYSAGARFGDAMFTLNVHPNELDGARLGMSVAARILPRSVDRNRVRRLIRDSFRLHQHTLPPVDIVVGVRVAVKTAQRAQLRAALSKIWHKVSATCANRSAS